MHNNPIRTLEFRPGTPLDRWSDTDNLGFAPEIGQSVLGESVLSRFTFLLELGSAGRLER